MSRTSSGTPSTYEDQECIDLVTALWLAFGRYPDNRGWMTITAVIEWDGSINPKPSRTTHMGPLALGAVRSATDAAIAARDAAGKSYAGFRRTAGVKPPATWQAQIRELTRTEAGYEAARAAGVSASKETQRRWLSWQPGEQAPSKANREALARAVISMRYEKTNAARASASTAGDRYLAAARAAADALSAAIRNSTYEAEVRFTDIEALDFYPR